MGRFVVFFTAILLSLPVCSALQAVDSVSYAYGNQSTLALLAGENTLMKDTADFRRFVRGLEENMPSDREMVDSAYFVSHGIGAMQGIFMNNAFEHMDSLRLPPVRCIIAGLRSVAERALELPSDTIAIGNYMRTLPGSIKVEELPAEEKCRFFTAYGVMKGLQPGVQEYLEAFRPGTSISIIQEAFAAGMADALEFVRFQPSDAYDIGRMTARSFMFEPNQVVRIAGQDFIKGAKAALGLEPYIVDRNECERIMQEKFTQYNPDEVVIEEVTVPTGGDKH